jgi:hypothetical protein
LGDENFNLSQSYQGKDGIHGDGCVDDLAEMEEEEKLDYKDTLQKERLEMERLDSAFEEKTKKYGKDDDFFPRT